MENQYFTIESILAEQAREDQEMREELLEHNQDSLILEIQSLIHNQL